MQKYLVEIVYDYDYCTHDQIEHVDPCSYAQAVRRANKRIRELRATYQGFEIIRLTFVQHHGA